MKPKHLKRAEASQRQLDRASRGDHGQLAKLESTGHGHCAEATRLRSAKEGK